MLSYLGPTDTFNRQGALRTLQKINVNKNNKADDDVSSMTEATQGPENPGTTDTNDEDVAHKGGRRASHAETAMLESAKIRVVENKAKRTMYVACTVDRALTSSKTNKYPLTRSQQKRRAVFHRVADVIGGLRMITGDIAYDTILAMDSCPPINKQFYDRILAAIQNLVLGDNKTNDYMDIIRSRAVGDDTYYSIEALKSFMMFPVVKKDAGESKKRKKKDGDDDNKPKVRLLDNRIKEPMTRDMADTAFTHASSMAWRCRNVLRYEVEVDLTNRGHYNKDEIKAICSKAKKALDVVPVTTFATNLGPLGSDDRLVKLIRSYQEQLPMNLPTDPKIFKPEKSTRKSGEDTTLDRVAAQIPHFLFKLATFASRRLDTYYPQDERDDDDFKIEDYTKDIEERNDEEEEEVVDANDKNDGDGDAVMKDEPPAMTKPDLDEKKKKTTTKKPNGPRRPMRFAFLPIWKLSAAMAEYTHTGLAVNWAKDAFESEPSVDSIAGDLFPDLTFIPQLKYPPGHPRFKHWYLEGFRTNGVDLQLRLICCQGDTPSAFNAANLCKSGYQLDKPPRKVQAREQIVHSNQKARDSTRFRGAIKLYQDRCDLVKRVLPETVVSIDPGENKPIQVAEISSRIPLKTNGTVDGSMATIEEHTSFWHVARTDYCRDAGYVRRHTFETARRTENPRYAAALERFRYTRRRTCDPDTFAVYAKTRAETFEAMREEANLLSRKTRKYHTRRRTQQKLDKIADDLVFGRGVVDDSRTIKKDRKERRRAWRQKEDTDPYGFVPDIPVDGDDVLRSKRRKLDSDSNWTDRMLTPPERHARPVFFGNGSWKSSGLPRKILVKKISTRGVCVITDEFLTSQSCPCCGGKKTLKDIERGSRLRYCTNSRTGNCCLTQVDRDVSGSFSIGLAVFWGLSGQPGRPPHLAR